MNYYVSAGFSPVRGPVFMTLFVITIRQMGEK